MRAGAIGRIENGKLRGRKFIIPSVVYVQKGMHLSGQPEYSRACLIHEQFIRDQGCDACAVEMAKEEKEAKEIGL